MSNSIAPGSSADVNVKVTALTTNPNVPAQYKTIILKKNLVNGVNTLTPQMMSAQNTKYVIKYDYVLGDDIDVPTNCILEFEGGSISGAYTLTGNSTKIIADTKIFDTNVLFAGTWDCDKVKSYWWSLTFNDSTYDNRGSIQKGIDLASITKNGKYLIDGNGTLYVDTTIEDHRTYWYTREGAINMKSNVHVEISNNLTIKIMNTNEENHSCFNFYFVENASIKGGNIKGDLDVNYAGKSGESGYGISIWSSNNIVIDGCNISYFLGDGIIISRCDDIVSFPIDTTNHQYSSRNVTIKNCDISYNGRQGISITGLISGVVENNYIHDIGQANYHTEPEAGIDVEPNKVTLDEIASNILIQGNSFSRCRSKSVMICDPGVRSGICVSNIIVQDCAVVDGGYRSQDLYLVNGNNSIIKNCVFSGISVSTIKEAHDYIKILNCKAERIDFIRHSTLDSEQQLFIYPANHVEISNCQFDLLQAGLFVIVFRGTEYVTFNNCCFRQSSPSTNRKTVQDFNDTIPAPEPGAGTTSENSNTFFNNCVFISKTDASEPTSHTGITYNNCSNIELPAVS